MVVPLQQKIKARLHKQGIVQTLFFNEEGEEINNKHSPLLKSRDAGCSPDQSVFEMATFRAGACIAAVVLFAIVLEIGWARKGGGGKGGGGGGGFDEDDEAEFDVVPTPQKAEPG